MSHVYFDHNATTALDSRVLQTMLPYLTQQQGNPSSRHLFGRVARDAIEHAREQVAYAVGAYASQVVFTSGGTEANNFAVTGIAGGQPATQIITSAIEHPCVTRPAEAMQKRGWQLSKIGVDQHCNLDLAALGNALQHPTCLVSTMLANNETGVIQDVATVAELAKRHGAYVHTDAVQALGKIPVNFADLNVHAMTISSHKINGPQGAGALILDKRVDIQPLLYGGGQEKGLRSGTENIAAIVGFGAACERTTANLNHYATHTKVLRNQLEQGFLGLKSELGITIFGNAAARVSNTSFFAVEGIEGETLVMSLDKKGYAIASGSACSSDSNEPSHVLLAMGVAEDLARGAIRVSFGVGNTTTQVADFLTTLKNEVMRLKQLAVAVV